MKPQSQQFTKSVSHAALTDREKSDMKYDQAKQDSIKRAGGKIHQPTNPFDKPL